MLQNTRDTGHTAQTKEFFEYRQGNHGNRSTCSRSKVNSYQKGKSKARIGLSATRNQVSTTGNKIANINVKKTAVYTHMLAATSSDSHIENSKNHIR